LSSGFKFPFSSKWIFVTKIWRCTVCGYLHEGDSPPESCPVCHATADKFELVETAVNRSLGLRLKDELLQMRETFAPHAVSAHFPAALIPTCTLFLLLAVVRGYQPLEFAAFALLVVIVISLPLTMLTGFLIWQKNYRKSRSAIFIKKICLAVTLLLVALPTLLWRWFNPDLLAGGGAVVVPYSLIHLLMLACVTLLGHYGGMLASAGRRK
jgi:uncharacterized membrane protein